MEVKWYTKKWVVILLHAICWVFIFSLPYLLRPAMDGQKTAALLKTKNLQYLFMANRVALVSLFYFNAYFIVPRFIYKRRYWSYGLALGAVFMLMLVIDWTAFSVLITGISYHVKNYFAIYTFPILFILTSSTAYRMIDDRVKEDRLQKEKENENLKTELSLLRSQVSPHFMFNIMNNMVALARKGSAELEPSLIKLSSLLRYMLYETHGKVSLQKEIEYLQSYIDLQKQRYGNNVTIKSCVDDIDRDYEVEPMLLIPFVENAFKHGTRFVSKVPGSDLVLYSAAEINIKLTAEKGVLRFVVQNRYNEDSTDIKDKTPGIGLTNVKRRLNLLYGNHHSLEIGKKDGWFTASLQIVLN
ncbi:MAG TPA: histidine kinase [Chitinophagaceae bacterium]|nr:histidine kinase [Chitinophagaceae bacterium]